MGFRATELLVPGVPVAARSAAVERGAVGAGGGTRVLPLGGITGPEML